MSLFSWFRSLFVIDEPLMVRIRDVRDSLAELIEPDFGLLDVLLSRDVLTHEEYDNVRHTAGIYRKNRELVEIILAKDERTRESFMSVLEHNEQPHVANFISNKPGLSMAEEFGDIRPLDDSTRFLLRMKRPVLIEKLDPEYGLLDLCFTVRCISREQMDALSGTNGPTNEKNRTLLDILTRRSVADFNNFMWCLKKCGQKHVVKLLMANGGICNMRCELNSTGEDVQPVEHAIVVNASEVLSDHLYRKLSDELKPLGSEVKLLWCESGHSIDCYFSCETLASLKHLRGLYKNGQLQTILEKFFTALLKNSKEIHLKNLSWAYEEYKRLVCYFKIVPALSWAGSTPSQIGSELQDTDSNLAAGSVSSRLLRFYNQVVTSAVPQAGSTPSKIGSELLARVEQASSVMQRLSIDSDTDSDLASGSLSTVLRAMTALSLGDLTSEPKVIQEISLADPVTGLALLCNELFVLIRRRVNQVEVYDSEKFSLRRRLPVEGLRDDMDNDITSCSHNICLFISDSYNDCIHRLELDGEVSRWPVNDSPNGLSVTTDYSVLVTCGVARKLKLFTANGKELRVISLLSDIAQPLHAVQLSTGQLVACDGRPDDSLHRVYTVDTDGNITQSCGVQWGSAVDKFNGPCHLAVDKDGSVFVADDFNSRVVLLHPTLKYVREIVSRELLRPRRLCLDVDKRRLYVSLLNGPPIVVQV